MKWSQLLSQRWKERMLSKFAVVRKGSSDNSTHGRCNLWLKKSRVTFCLAVVNSERILEEKDDLAFSKCFMSFKNVALWTFAEVSFVEQLCLWRLQ